MFEWMLWTSPVAVFYSCIGLMLVGMTLWEIKRPTVMRRGFLPLDTTRGDRLFIGLLTAAYIDGYTFPRFFVRIFLPLIKAGVGVAAFFCFMFSWVELLLARTLTSVNAKPIVATMTRTVSASGMDWATLAAAGVLTIVPGAIVIWFVRHYIAKGFAMGRV